MNSFATTSAIAKVPAKKKIGKLTMKKRKAPPVPEPDGANAEPEAKANVLRARRPKPKY